jgi:NADH-quinone oxidoreductase subunit N
LSGFLPILPEACLLLLALLLLILDPFVKVERRRRSFLGWFTAVGLLIIFILTVVVDRPGNPLLVYGGMLRYDQLGWLFELFFLFSAAVTSLFFMDTDRVNQRAESYLLLVAATMGMCFMASASDLIMLYLAIETTSIPLYLLAGFLKEDEKSTESGFKYLLFGAVTSAILLYGFSMVFGFTGHTNLYQLASFFRTFTPLAIGSLFLILAGLAFKVSLFPFHFWAPDVYEGAPTPVSGFLSTASKAAGFAVLLRLFTVAFPALSPEWSMILAVLAALTMTIGNLIALTQKNVKRLLAYSSIAHAGYASLGLVAFARFQGSGEAAGQFGLSSTIFYLLAYLLTNLAAFGVVGIVGRATGSDEFPAYNGLSRRNPALALATLVAFLSLAGMPPFAGFVAKVFVFAAAIESGWVWLTVLGVVNAIIGLYYYLNFLKYVYLYRMEGQDEAAHPLLVTRPVAAAMILLVAGILLVGILFGPWFTLTLRAATTVF